MEEGEGLEAWPEQVEEKIEGVEGRGELWPLKKLRGLSHLNELKFKHHLRDCANSLLQNSLEVESLSHFIVL